MEATSGPSSSTVVNECNKLIYCRACHKILHQKDIIRLIIMGQLSVIVAHQYFENGYVKIISKTTINMYKMSREKQGLRHIFHHPNDPNTWSAIKVQEEIITHIMKRLSEYLEIDISFIHHSVQHLLSSAYEVYVDFDLQVLMTASKQSKQAIEDIMVKVFWYPLHSPKKGLENGNWFDSVDRGNVIPFYLKCDEQVDHVIDNYLKCIHVIEQSVKKVMRWYFSDMNGSRELQTYSMFLKSMKEKKRLLGRSIIKFEEGGETILKNHVIHVFRYFFNNNYASGQNCAFENQDTVEIFRNPFMQMKHSLPFIVQGYNPQISKYVFHMVYKDDIQPTVENFYQLLVLLRDIFMTVEIDSVEMTSCRSYNVRKVLKMIQYVLCDHGIAVTIVDLKKGPTCCGIKLSLF